jgi:hypothetical protein
MSVLEHLGKGTLPYAAETAFVDWCVWEQARLALITVLEKTVLSPVTYDIRTADSLSALTSLGNRIAGEATHAHDPKHPLALSAAKAVVFEFNSLLRAVADPDLDAEEVAFFAARVCGWAGWAATDFSRPDHKILAESKARRQQAAHLQELLQDAAQV